jgi:hypothetical protein
VDGDNDGLLVGALDGLLVGLDGFPVGRSVGLFVPINAE